MAAGAIVSLLVLGVVSVTAHHTQQNKFSSLDNDFHDLTFPFNSDTVYWPNAEPFKFTKVVEENRSDDTWYASNDFSAGEHGGTHLDAPYHFARGGRRVGDIPLSDLILPLIVVDVSSLANGNPNFVLYKHHLDFILNDNLGHPCVIVFKFGWSQYYHDRQQYLGYDDSNRSLNFPVGKKILPEWYHDEDIRF